MNTPLSFAPTVRTFLLGSWRKSDRTKVEVTLRQLPPRAAFRAAAIFAKIAGPMLAPLLAGADGLRIGDTEIPWVAVKAEKDAQEAVVTAVMARLGQVDADMLLGIADAMLVGHCKIGEIEIVMPEMLDVFVPDFVAFAELVKASLVLNFFPSMPGDTTNAESSPGKTSPQPVGI